MNPTPDQRPPPFATFLCDEMLQGLGRRLRAAGYDTLIAAAGTPDRELWQLARAQQRLLITRDRKFLEYRDSEGRVILLGPGGLRDHIRELSRKLDIDWLHAPFSRCLLCNTPVQAAGPEHHQRVPPRSRPLAQPLWFCPSCDKVYWAGGHVQRMLERMREWNG